MKSTTGRAGVKAARESEDGERKTKKPVSANAKKTAEAKPNLVEDVVEVDVSDADIDVADIVDDVDPLTDLVARTKEDPSAPFAPEVLAALSEMKKSDKRAFESLRAQLKRAGCRISSLEESLSEEIGAGPGAKAQTQADILLRSRRLSSFSTPPI